MTGPLENNIQQPSLTILIALYDRLELLKAAVKSALTQQYSNFSNHHCWRCLWRWNHQLAAADWIKRDKDISLFSKVSGRRCSQAYGVEKARTELICILDSDDILVSNALEKLVKAMFRKPGTRLVHCDIRELWANGDVALQQYSQFKSAHSMTMTTLLKPRAPFKHSGTLFWRQTALDPGSYNTDLPCKVDIDLYLKFLKAGYLPEHVSEPLVDFMMHKDSVSINRLQGIRVWLYFIGHYWPEKPLYRQCIQRSESCRVAETAVPGNAGLGQ